MKAVILLGGSGTRLGHLTKNLPKPLIKIGGKPVLERHLELLAESGIKEAFLLTGYLGEKIREFCGNGRRFGLRLRYSQNPPEYNTADRVLALQNEIKDAFLLLYGDVVMNFNIKKFISFHRSHK